MKNYIYISDEYYTAMDFVNNVNEFENLIPCDNMKMGEYSYVRNGNKVYELRYNVLWEDKNILCYCLR